MSADVLLNQFDGLQSTGNSKLKILPYAVEATWVTGKWDKLDSYLSILPPNSTPAGNFNLGVGAALQALRKTDLAQFSSVIRDLRQNLAKGMTSSTTSSLQACHGTLLQLQTLTEMESIGLAETHSVEEWQTLDRRLDVLGSYLSDKQYILGIRRATMQLS